MENCEYYVTRELDEKTNSDSDFTSLFFIIDGNKSNFGMFVSELSALNHKFSVIGLAETNTDHQQASLYPIDNYNSFYSETLPGKSKGTGVALYVYSSFNATINKLLGIETPDIESLLSIHQTHIC